MSHDMTLYVSRGEGRRVSMRFVRWCECAGMSTRVYHSFEGSECGADMNMERMNDKENRRRNGHSNLGKLKKEKAGSG